MDGSGKQSRKLWTRDFILALATSLFISMVFFLLMTSMALYAVDRFRASDSAAGLAASGFVIGAVAARLFAGRLFDVVGRRRLLLASLLASVAAILLYFAADSLVLLVTLRVLHGVAFGAGHTALAASVQTLIPPGRRSEGTGYFGLSNTLSTAVGPLLAVILAGSGGYAGIFWFCAACSLAAFAVAFALNLPEPHRAPAHGARPARLARLAALVEPKALPVSTVIFLAGAAYSTVLAFLTSYTQARGVPSAAATFFLIYAGTVLVSRLFMGRIQDRRGDNLVMYPTILAFAGGLALLAAGPSGWTLAGAAVLSGLGFGALMPCIQAIAVSESPELRVGTATSTFYLMLDAGTGLGPVFLGMLIPAVNYEGMYLAVCAVMLGAAVLYWFVHGRKRRGPRTAA
ncbi:MFS transporter [Arthrobacter mobilis]|uniref:MFS transporter n=1 Tax=Arthrobacter mobilis TaxID=2724944 RepID=A0A7X6HC23_9MICC|nr:MFS transporter [Arthrobacter mobilis]NKX54358.1 MFS transporter [Arthrobacter mobilis]